MNSPKRATSRRSSVRIGDCAWHWLSRKVEKSWWPDQRLRRLMHGARIKLHRHKPHLAEIKGGRRPAVENAVEIMPFRAGKPGVERIRHKLRLKNANPVRPDACIDGIAQDKGIPFAQQIHMRHLPQRMNPRIGAARPLQQGRRAIDAGNGSPSEHLAPFYP